MIVYFSINNISLFLLAVKLNPIKLYRVKFPVIEHP